MIKFFVEIKNEVEEGFSFRLKAIINSDDPAVSGNGPGSGGKYTITRKSGFIKEFKEVAFSLDEGQVSDPFKSGFGYHIIMVDKIKGQERDVSHILIQPEISSKEMKAAEDELLKVRTQILEGEITFEEAVLKYSDEKETKMNKGLILNPESNDTKFDLTRMDPQLYNRVSNLKTGEITNFEVYADDLGGRDCIIVDDICDGGDDGGELPTHPPSPQHQGADTSLQCQPPQPTPPK